MPANNTKKTTSTITKPSEPDKQSSIVQEDVSKENDLLKNQIEELQAQMTALFEGDAKDDESHPV